MLNSYFKIAFRHLLKNKAFSLVNISGLAVGIAVAFLILQYLSFEMGYDRFHQNKDEIFRVISSQQENGELKNKVVGTFFGAGNFMKTHFPEVKDLVRFYKWPANTGVLLMTGGKIFNERNYFFAESSFFKVFPTLLVQGDATTCLADPHAIVISKRQALKMFGTTDVMGKSITYLERNKGEVVITGLMMDLPQNSHFDLDIVRPYDHEWIPEEENYWRGNWWTYVTIKNEASIQDLENRLNESLLRDQKDNTHYLGTSMSLQKITDVHLYSHLEDELGPNGNTSLVYILGSALIMILVIAWINYINLETARFVTRLKEVGVRRIVGSSKRELTLQFLVQYLCINILAALLACMIIAVALPYYQQITGIPIDNVQLSDPRLWGTALTFFISGTFVTGVYPTLLLMKFNPVASLKGKLTWNVQGVALRKSLVVFQFVSSLTMIAFLVIISKQLEFMRHVNGNINLGHVLTIYNPTNYSAYEDSLRQERNSIFKNRLLQDPSIENLTTSSAIPGEPVGFTYTDLAKRSLNDPDRQVPYKVVYIDYDFIPVFGLKLKAGRNYIPESGEDLNYLSLVVTESTVRELGFVSNEEAIGQEIFFMEAEWEKWKIVGIVEDYRHESVKSPIYPTIFRLHRNRGQMVYYSIRLNAAARPGEAVAAAENAWKATWPEKPFNYFFLDAYYDRQYQSEVYFGRIFSTFSVVAIFIACLGIMGMTLFEANVRLKEISIRKVLGASVRGLVALLSKKYFTLIGIASLISLPFIYFSATAWLKNYPLRVNFPLVAFLAPIAIISLLVVLTSCFQTIKAAHTNPVDHLKNE